MRERFRGFYPPTAEELEELWSSGSIILDTNALLNLYRYSSETRTDFLSVLSAVQERLWIPEQVGKEFHANRLGVIEVPTIKSQRRLKVHAKALKPQCRNSRAIPL
jgi:hypothetical protein